MRPTVLALGLLVAVAQGGGYQRIPAGEYRSVLKYEDVKGNRAVASFEIMTQPVTNGDFLRFVWSHKEWRRGQVLALYAEPNAYLSHWLSPTELGSAVSERQPVTRVSWFAATAYCESQQARLPTWSEWEYVAAADETRRDARQDAAWRERILGWYSRNAGAKLANVGQTTANSYGVQDLHGLIWEWTEDYSAMLVSSDNRNQSEADRARYCGAGALAVDDRENYPVMMRVALLSSLRGADSTSSLGFRCARSLP